MKNSRLELCNRIRMEAEHTEDTGFPLDAFPQAVQSVILDMTKYENYMIEFIATSMLSAASTALGGTYRIRIKSDWQSNGALYIILVGRPGLGKTPPLEAAYRPIRKHDYALFKAYEGRSGSMESGRRKRKKPVLHRTIVSDFTPESLLQTHNSNPRSVAILVDEIMGMFNSANRYTNGQLIEQLTDRMEWRSLGCNKGKQFHSCTYRTPVHQHHRNCTDQTYSRTSQKRIRGKRTA